MTGRQPNGRESLWYAPRKMHEWPLVIFTALAVPSAGAFAACLVAALSGARLPHAARLLAWAALALSGGLVASFAHLGQPLRSRLVVRGAGRSWLSTEIIMAGALLLLALLAIAAPFAPPVREILIRLAGVAGLGLLAALGLVYYLPGRLPWRSALVATPLLSGLATGLMLASGGEDRLAQAWTSLLTDGKLGAYALCFLVYPIVFLLLDAILFTRAWLALSDRLAWLPTYPAIFVRRRRLAAIRLLLVDVAPVALLLARVPAAAAISMLAGIFLDRFTFYGAAAHCSPEAEIVRVESQIANRQC